MCNLYRNRTGAAEVARLFKVEPGDVHPGNAAEEVYPGYPGMVVREVEGRPVLQSMSWGLPVRLKSMGPTSKPKPVNNARDAFWRPSFESRRCIIPVTQWAEAEGEMGRMTRTWYSLPDVDVIAIAGIWRPTDQWGACYSMVMVAASAVMSDVHDRMPVILEPDDCARWMLAPPGEAFELVRTWGGQLVVDRSAEAWFQRREQSDQVKT